MSLSPSKRNRICKILALISGLLSCAAVPLSTLLFMQLFRAEGPKLWLLIQGSLAALLVFALSRVSEAKGRRIQRLKPLVQLASALALGSLALIILVQLNVARQSLALAWLELARNNSAFGYFSFFAAQIWTIFVIPLPYLTGKRRPLAVLMHAGAALALAAGLILDKSLLEILALTLAIPAWFVFAQGPLSGRQGKTGGGRPILISIRSTKRLLALPAPLLLGTLLSLAWLGLVSVMPQSTARTNKIDFTPLIQSMAPHFPLLADMPGYGFSVSAVDMPRSVFLSQRIIFDVSGPPFETLYLGEGRFQYWNGLDWEQTESPGRTIEVRPIRPEDRVSPSSIRLALREDFMEVVPLADTTELVLLSGLLPQRRTEADIQAFTHRGISFKAGAQRGLNVILEPGKGHGREEETFTPAQRRSSIPIEVKRLVASLPAPDGPYFNQATEDFLRALNRHFDSGYTYSLSTPPWPADRDPVGYFLEEGKKGFCVWFAAAFVLACQEAGLEARMAQGYRVLLDQAGQGRVRGYNAHAWPEVLIDGSWLRFEPTPPFGEGDPFAALARDRNTREQIAALFGPNEGEDGNAGVRLREQWPVIALVLAGLGLMLLLAFTALRLFESPIARDARQGRHIVARYRKLGIARPEEIGWLAWSTGVRTLNWKGRAELDCALAERIWQEYYSR